MLPATVSREDGDVVPMPTLPILSIRIPVFQVVPPAAWVCNCSFVAWVTPVSLKFTILDTYELFDYQYLKYLYLLVR